MAPKHKPRTATKAVGKCKKQAKKKAATIPAWECPKCGATHPITVGSCCKQLDPQPLFAPRPFPRNTYGFCPICGSPGANRERRPDGNDVCSVGHVYPSNQARVTP